MHVTTTSTYRAKRQGRLGLGLRVPKRRPGRHRSKALSVVAVAITGLLNTVDARLPAQVAEVRATASQALDPQLDQSRLVDRGTTELYRRELEATNTRWEALRRSLEEQRLRGNVDSELYSSLLASYRSGITAYRDGIEDYRAIDEAYTVQSFLPTDTTAIAHLWASRAALADASLTLSLAEALTEGPTAPTIAEQAQEALSRSFDTATFSALQSYIQDRFPTWDGRSTASAYATSIQVFADDVLERASRLAAPLEITSTPPGASISIHPKYSTTRVRVGTTDVAFPNLYVGLYLISVTLPGHKDYEAELDWLDDDQPILSCTLVRQDAPVSSTCSRGR